MFAQSTGFFLASSIAFAGVNVAISELAQTSKPIFALIAAGAAVAAYMLLILAMRASEHSLGSAVVISMSTTLLLSAGWSALMQPPTPPQIGAIFLLIGAIVLVQLGDGSSQTPTETAVAGEVLTSRG